MPKSFLHLESITNEEYLNIICNYYITSHRYKKKWSEAAYSPSKHYLRNKSIYIEECLIMNF